MIPHLGCLTFPPCLAPYREFREHTVRLGYRSDHIVPWHGWNSRWETHAMPHKHSELLPTIQHSCRSSKLASSSCPAIISSHFPRHTKNWPLPGCSLYPPGYASICLIPEFQELGMTAETYGLLEPFCWVLFLFFLFLSFFLFMASLVHRP